MSLRTLGQLLRKSNMADFLDGDVGELELEVSFNEFEDELIRDDDDYAEDKSGPPDIPGAAVNACSSAGAICERDEVDSDNGELLDSDGEIAEPESEAAAGAKSHGGSENLPGKDSNFNQLSRNTKAEKRRELTRQKDDSKARGANTGHGGQRKRKLSCSMEVDEGSDQEESEKLNKETLQNGSSDKKAPLAENGGDRVKNKTRGGRKKKKRRHSPNPDQRFQSKERDFDKELYDLFQPLNVTHKSTEKDVASELAERLQERKSRLIHKVVQTIGCAKALELLDLTKKVQIRGGMTTMDGSRRRTCGGVFLTLLKSDRFATKEQVKEIFAEENEHLKHVKKAKQVQQNKLKREEIQDLRKKLQHDRRVSNDVDMESVEQQTATTTAEAATTIATAATTTMTTN